MRPNPLAILARSTRADLTEWTLRRRLGQVGADGVDRGWLRPTPLDLRLVGDQVATDAAVITRKGTRRVVDFAFRLARRPGG